MALLYLAHKDPRPSPIRDKMLCDRLNIRFHRRATAIQSLKISGLTAPQHSITAPFIATRDFTAEAGAYARIYTALPTKSHSGVHELKIIGGKDSQFFIMEIHEPTIQKDSLGLASLKAIADRRNEALLLLSTLDIDTPKAEEILDVITRLSFRPFPMGSVNYVRWISTLPALSFGQPKRMLTIEAKVHDNHTVFELNQSPFHPREIALSKQFMGSDNPERGELIEKITKILLAKNFQGISDLVNSFET